MQTTWSIIITGKVQGVFFRQSTKEKAKELGITGYVMNMEDGNVKILASGTKDNLEALAAWCKQGPPKAKVDKVLIEELPVEEFGGFGIVRQD